MEIGPNMAYEVTVSKQSETAFTDDNIYELDLPDVPDVRKKESTFSRQNQLPPKKKFRWLSVTITVVALLGLAFGIAALVFTIARSSNQEQLLQEANMSLEAALSQINRLQQDIQEIRAELFDAQLSTPQPATEVSQSSTPPSTTEVPTTAEPTTEPPIHGCPGEGWRPVIQLDMNDTNQNCPEGWQLTDYSDTIRTCGRVNTNVALCDSTIIPSEGQYSEVCGRATAYRCGDPVAFSGHSNFFQGIDGYYLDGLSVTHGSPYTHIWSFASGFFAGVSVSDQQPFSRCPCDPGNTAASPSFVGSDFFCESVVTERGISAGGFYPDNALWDGVDSIYTCYNEPSVPWFVKTLPSATTDDIEVRICSSNGNHRETAINQMELYVR